MCNVVRELPVTIEEIKEKAENDVFIAKIKMQLKESIKERNSDLNAYLLCNIVVRFGQRVGIPSVLQKQILRDFHSGHPGISRIKYLMRSFVYWTRMNQDIEKKNSVSLQRLCSGSKTITKIEPWPKRDTP